MYPTPNTDQPLPSFEHSTTDLYCAAAATTAGLCLDAIVRHGGRAVFVFAPDPRLAETVQNYYRGALSVDARGFADAIRGLKAAVHVPAVPA